MFLSFNLLIENKVLGEELTTADIKNTAWRDVIFEKGLDFIEGLIKNDSPILHETDKYGNTILHPMVSMFSSTGRFDPETKPKWWSNEKFYELTKALLYDISVDANKPNNGESLPLHWIDPDKVKLVMDKTDDVNKKNNGGNSPAFNHIRHPGISPLFDHPSLDVTIRNHRWETLSHWASSFCRPDLIEKLLDRGAEKTLYMEDKIGKTPKDVALSRLEDATEDEDFEEVKECGYTLSILNEYS
ncbi:MAG: hypothetical protein OXB86_04655 [Bdellovibrionales bacterium]|nr:hypothetical protein [Bdellovibrionales bacterium]